LVVGGNPFMGWLALQTVCIGLFLSVGAQAWNYGVVGKVLGSIEFFIAGYFLYRWWRA